MGKRRGRGSYDQPGGIWRQEFGGMPLWGIVGALVLMVGLGITAVSGMPQQATADPNRQARPVPTFDFSREETAVPLRVAVVGDSNTEANSPDFAAGDIGDGSWVAQFLDVSGAVFSGGWADGGSTSSTQAQNLAPAEADLLLIMTGTNDTGRVPFSETTANIDAMVAKVPAPRVVLLAIPPRDVELDPTTEEFNADLAALASARGWEFHDGLAFLRSPDGGFIENTTADGVHLTWEAQQEYGRAVASIVAP